MRIAALIVAAGRGTRAAVSGVGPKQYALIGGAPVLWHTLRAFAGNSAISDIQVVIHRDDAEFYRESVPVGGGDGLAGRHRRRDATGFCLRRPPGLECLEAGCRSDP